MTDRHDAVVSERPPPHLRRPPDTAEHPRSNSTAVIGHPVRRRNASSAPMIRQKLTCRPRSRGQPEPSAARSSRGCERLLDPRIAVQSELISSGACLI